jgi:Centromere DNA-binding protein complex CBF3 subunit, domain 2
VFPWVEREQAALLARVRSNPLANDMALKQFLNLLVWLRKVLLQDAAVLFSQDPSCPIFQCSIFCSAAFHSFAKSALPTLADAEERARLALEQLPDHLIRALRGLLTDMRVEQQQNLEYHRNLLLALDERFGHVEGLMKTLIGSKSHQKYQSGQFAFFFALICLTVTPLTHSSPPPTTA